VKGCYWAGNEGKQAFCLLQGSTGTFVKIEGGPEVPSTF